MTSYGRRRRGLNGSAKHMYNLAPHLRIRGMAAHALSFDAASRNMTVAQLVSAIVESWFEAWFEQQGETTQRLFIESMPYYPRTNGQAEEG